ARRALAPLHIPGLRLARFTWQTHHSGEPDGFPLRPRYVHRGSFCAADVPLAAHAARACAARYPKCRARHALARSVAAHRPAGEIALSGARWRRRERRHERPDSSRTTRDPDRHRRDGDAARDRLDGRDRDTGGSLLEIGYDKASAIAHKANDEDLTL